MRFRQLGGSGLRVSVVGLGTVKFGGPKGLDANQSRAVIDAALDAGINLIDTADVYGACGGSEEVIGQALEGRRDDVVIATKFGVGMRDLNGADLGARASRRYIVRAVEGSLRRLRTDYIDLYQLHIPDNITPWAETLEALDDLVRSGKVRYAGSAQLAGWQVVEAEWISRDRRTTRFISTQTRYSLLDREAENHLVKACATSSVSILPYFPLATGLLTGRLEPGGTPPPGSRMAQCVSLGLINPRSFAVIERLQAFANERGISLVEVAIGGLAAKPEVGSVVAGATSADQVRANARATDWVPTRAESRILDEMAPKPGLEGRLPQLGSPPPPAGQPSRSHPDRSIATAVQASTGSTRANVVPLNSDGHQPDYASLVRLDGRRIVVFGAGNQIGREAARALGSMGAEIACICTDPASVRKLRRELGCVSIRAGIGVRTDMDKAFGRAEQELQGIDGVVDATIGNAGEGLLTELTDDDWQHQFYERVEQAALAVELGAAAIIRAGGGTIALLTSSAAQKSEPAMGAYCAAETALVSLVRTAAIELGPLGVRVNAVAPPITITAAASDSGEMTEWLSGMAKGSPTRRLPTSVDVAAALLFLTSELSGNVNGQSLSVDGGASAK
jgi:aryl-alcohol dehydrogenase-like predicted oxidoreductase/NAD(P)-dependent dehydrogenase (short-subunit alcohol dehydrogenase family)